MTTIPSRLAQMTRTSGSPTVARQRVLQLYRDWYRSVRIVSLGFLPASSSHNNPWYLQAPEIVTIYALNTTPQVVRQTIRAGFERNRYVSDPKVIDILITKGRQDYQECMNCWMQEPHVMGILLAPKDRPQRTFMQKFLEGLCATACI